MDKTKPIEKLVDEIRVGDLVRIELERSDEPDEPLEYSGYFYGVSSTTSTATLAFTDIHPVPKDHNRSVFLGTKEYRLAGLSEKEDPLYVDEPESFRSIIPGQKDPKDFKKAVRYEIMNR